MRYDIDNLWYFYASNDETKSIMKKHFLNWHCYRCMFLSQWEWYDDVMMWMQWYDDVIIFQPQWWFYKRLIAIKGDVHDQSFFYEYIFGGFEQAIIIKWMVEDLQCTMITMN